MNDKLQIFQNALKDALKATEAAMNKEEFLNAFKEVIAHVKKVESELIKTIGNRLSKADTDFDGMVAQMKEMRQAFEQTIKETRKANDSTFAQIKQRSLDAMNEMFRKMDVQGKMDAMYAEHEAMMRKCEAKMPDTEKMMQEMKAQMPPQKTPEQIRDGLEALEGNERLDMKAIRDLKEELEKLSERISAIPRGRTGMRRIPIIKRENLTSQVDGNTRSFTLPKDTVAVLGLYGTQFPINFDSADWTLSGNTLTLASGISTPESGQTLFAIIETLFYG